MSDDLDDSLVSKLITADFNKFQTSLAAIIYAFNYKKNVIKCIVFLSNSKPLLPFFVWKE